MKIREILNEGHPLEGWHETSVFATDQDGGDREYEMEYLVKNGKVVDVKFDQSGIEEDRYFLEKGEAMDQARDAFEDLKVDFMKKREKEGDPKAKDDMKVHRKEQGKAHRRLAHKIKKNSISQ